MTKLAANFLGQSPQPYTDAVSEVIHKYAVIDNNMRGGRMLNGNWRVVCAYTHLLSIFPMPILRSAVHMCFRNVSLGENKSRRDSLRRPQWLGTYCCPAGMWINQLSGEGDPHQ